MKSFREDLRRYFAKPVTFGGVCHAVCDVKLWAIATFRFGKRLQRIKLVPIRKALMLLYFFLYKTCETVSKVRISSNSEIGPGLIIHGAGGNVIRGRLGSNCEIHGDVQLTSRADGKNRGWPTLGDNIRIHAGAKIVGKVTVGNNVEIGANAVVSTDVPDDSVVISPESFVRPRASGVPRVKECRSD